MIVERVVAAVELGVVEAAKAENVGECRCLRKDAHERLIEH